MIFSNKNLRNILRVIHLVVAGLVITYIYSPLGNMEWFASPVRILVPILTITGVLMWQMPSVVKFLKRQLVPGRS
ncbi:MAG TPA: hypothetical protein VMT73_00130 [Anaerolineales bacterium]|nr:hypothetical protein [Anaerolineales bacterium]